ncbi:MAG: BatD family protein [Bacteroidales bacterium]|nr:BatD family protein [Bacteroidales bacterium]
MIKKLYILLLLTTLSIGLQAQSTFATVSVYPKKVYVGQSAKLTIKVYTTTWFTKGVEFEKMKIDGAFLVPYQRNQPFSTDIKGKQYSGVEFFFLMIPYKSGEVVFPSLTINIVTPPEGDYKGKKRVVRTREIKIAVNDVPLLESEDDWYMLTNSIYVSEKWNKPLKNLKTGDVLVRTVRVRANGTLPNFIPEFKVDSLDFASIYPDDFTTYEDKKTENIYGVRTDKIKYLLTKEGDFTFPDEKFYYFNPRTKKVGTKKLKGKTIKVELNEDLAYAQSVQDSLDAFLMSQIKPVEAEKEVPLLILGLKPWQFGLASILVLFLLYKASIITIRFIKQFKVKQKELRSSEHYLFSRMLKASKHKSMSEFQNAFTKWKFAYGLDEFNQLILNNNELNEEYNKIQRNYSNENNFSAKKFGEILKNIKEQKTTNISVTLNP